MRFYQEAATERSEWDCARPVRGRCSPEIDYSCARGLASPSVIPPGTHVILNESSSPMQLVAFATDD